jgi:hypothetical protein
LKFPSGNQPEEDNAIISKLDAKKCTILQLSRENSRKLLPLASALENTDSVKKMSDSKLQKCLFDSAKQLKLKEFKYDSIASALENTDSVKKMSDSKLQKCLFDSAKQLKLKEFKYDSNPSMRRRLFQSFYNQLVSVLSSVELFEVVFIGQL